jgi:uncharacterized protein YfaS (alpha-2-macroglobulin family)
MTRSYSLSSRIVSAVLLVALVFFGVATVSAQSTSGTIIGEVRDSSGAAVPNAQVVVTNSDTGVVRNATSNAEGVYNVPYFCPASMWSKLARRDSIRRK